MLKAAGATDAVIAATMASTAPRVTSDAYAPPRTANVCYRKTRYVGLFPRCGGDDRPKPARAEPSAAAAGAEFAAHVLLAILHCLRR